MYTKPTFIECTYGEYCECMIAGGIVLIFAAIGFVTVWSYADKWVRHFAYRTCEFFYLLHLCIRKFIRERRRRK